MTEQQYRVIADRDKGDDMDAAWWGQATGDRITEIVVGPGETRVDRIERQVPTTDESPRRSFIVTPNSDRYEAFDIEDALINSRSFLPEGVRVQPSPHPPTREQIAEAIRNSDWDSLGNWDAEPERIKDDYRKNADAVLALIQNGADR